MYVSRILASCALMLLAGCGPTVASVCEDAAMCGKGYLCEPPARSVIGQCTMECAADSDCKGADTECVGDRCMLRCETDDDCPDATICHIKYCIAPCSSDDDCVELAFCPTFDAPASLCAVH